MLEHETIPKKPNLFHLQQQQFQLMAEEYKRVNLHPFPLDQFSESIYQAKVKGEDALPSNYLVELECMERHKMMGSRQQRDERGAPIAMPFFWQSSFRQISSCSTISRVDRQHSNRA
jgi:hypothetical protein